MQAFWETLNNAEVALQRPGLPKIVIEDDATDKAALAKATGSSKGSKEGRSAPVVRGVSLKPSLDKEDFMKLGFKVGSCIEKVQGRGDHDEDPIEYTIKAIPDGAQNVELQTVTEGDEEEGDTVTKTHAEIADQFKVKVKDEIKAVISIGH